MCKQNANLPSKFSHKILLLCAAFFLTCMDFRQFFRKNIAWFYYSAKVGDSLCQVDNYVCHRSLFFVASVIFFNTMKTILCLTLPCTGWLQKCDKTIFFLILRAINAIEILKDRRLPFVLKRHFTTPKRGKEEFLIILSYSNYI